MKIWYVIAFDVAGGIHEWSGPWTYSLAVTAARMHERKGDVSQARLSRKSPVMQPWLRSTSVR